MSADVPPSPGLNMDHGFVKKIEQHQYNRQHQAQGEQARKQEVARLARRVGAGARNAKPTRQIYKPPSMRGSFSTDDFSSLHQQHQAPSLQHQQHIPVLEQDQQQHLITNGLRNAKVSFNLDPAKGPVELKSALKRSKSFGGSEAMETALLDREAMPREYEALVKKAIDNPNLLTSRQLMEVVRVLCSKAVESSQSAEPAAQMCFTIIQKEKGETFLESLMNSCREWFNERDKLLPRGGASPHRRWTAYVAFLTELYMRLKSRHHQVSSGRTETSTGPLLALLYESCQIILSTVAYNNVAEVECLRSVLMTVGPSLELDCPDRMHLLTAMMRDAFLVPSVSAQVRKTLLELVELHASRWTLDLPQSMYYFPYTSVDRKGL